MNSLRGRNRTLWQYTLLTYLLLLVNAGPLLREIHYDGIITALFAGATFLTYCLIYLLPAAAVMFGLNRLLFTRPLTNGWISPRTRDVVVFGTAVILYSLLQVLVYADRFIYHLYGFHLNGFVWNLVFTRGGIESLGGSASTNVSFTLIIIALAAMQLILLAAALKLRPVQSGLSPMCRRRPIVAAAVLTVGLGAFERVTYGVSNLQGFGPVLAASTVFPLYMPITFNGLAKRFGYEIQREPSMNVEMDSARLDYPLRPLQREPVARPLNIVWLVAESLRWDMLDPKIMPNAWQFARRAQCFQQHYSGGNGTRMGMFAMFYGLYGNYWFPFLAERRGPVFIDTLLDMNYQMKMFTSAKFTYPEFDQTIFARIPPERLHEGTAQPKWRRDIENVDLMLEFIGSCEPSRPFMTFMFFETTHANYYFPKEAIVAEPYAEDLNYATMDLQRDIALIKNRYINACHQLDREWGRVLGWLEERKLLDSTLIILTGDHGEEFMENGRWGHNSEFTEEQIRPPLVLWLPGHAPREVTRMTSHLDLPATLLPLLGVQNEPADYSLGHSLLSDTPRDYTIVCDWDAVGFVGPDHKAVFPMSGYQFARQKVTTRGDDPVEDRAAFYERNKQQIIRVMKELTRFTR